MRGRAGKYLQTLAMALDTGSSWLAILEGRKGVKLFSAVGPLCSVGDIHGWQNSLSLWTCSPAMHRMLVINNTTIDARHGGLGSGLGAGAHHTVQHSDMLLQTAGCAAESFRSKLLVATGTPGWASQSLARQCVPGQVHRHKSALSCVCAGRAAAAEEYDLRRVSESTYVTEGPKIRFCAGAPLVASSGHRIGALCATPIRLPQEPTRLPTHALARCCEDRSPA